MFWNLIFVYFDIVILHFRFTKTGKPSLRLLYVTPELIATPGYMSKLTKIHARGLLNLIAVDEV